MKLSVKTAPEIIKCGPAIPTRNAGQQQASQILSRYTSYTTLNFLSRKEKEIRTSL
jgi:hypothetical protein